MAKESSNELATLGKLVEDDDLISFVISGLNPLFNTFVTVNSFAARDLQMSFADFQSELLNHEMLLENQQHKAITPETSNFALYTNKQGPFNFNSTNFKKPRFPPRLRPRLVRGLGPRIGLVLANPLFGNILFLGVVYSHGTTNPIYTGLAKPFKNEWLS